MHKPTRILAIDPGTREMGIADLENGNLVYHTVAVARTSHLPHDTLDRGRSIVHALMDDFRPDTLAIEKTFIRKNRNLALLNVFADEIKLIAKRHGLTVVSYAPNTVEKAITGLGWASKEAVAQAVLTRYPELKPYLVRDPKWKNRFHANMFDAVAVGLVAAVRFVASP